MFRLIVENNDKECTHEFTSKEELITIVSNFDVKSMTGSLEFKNGTYIFFSQVAKDNFVDMVNFDKLMIWEHSNEKILQPTKNL